MSKLTWTNEKRRLGDLIPWERNPRQIRHDQARRLEASWQEFGQVETIAIGPDNEVYNGHQRINVLMAKHGPDYEVDVRVASRPLTEKEREKLTVFLHKGAAGEFDFDELASWDVPDLLEWGFERWELGIVDDVDYDELWQGMPEFEQEDLTPEQSIKVHFANIEARDAFAELVGQTITENTKFIWYPQLEIRHFMDKVYTDES